MIIHLQTKMIPILIVVLSALLATEARPSCIFDDLSDKTTCTSGDTDYILNRGLVSDNNDTTSISLKGCRLSGVGLDSFHGLPRLRNLDLSNNKIQRLKLGVLDGATGLTHLNLAFNQIQELPLGLFDQKTRLELLDLKGNRLSEFKLGIFNPLSRLGHLDLSSNRFVGKEISPFLFDKCRDITFMDFSGSDMRNAPDNLLKAFTKIYFLNLSGNSLLEIPLFATRSNLGTMYHLMLINNVITKLDDPNILNNLVNLGMINFAGNPIESIHEDFFKNLKNIRSVVVAGGQLKSIPETLFTGLEKLTDVDLSSNLLEFIPVNAFRGTALKNLNLANNRFTYLTDNFVLELSNSGASLKSFNFDKNPWQCACLRDIMKEVKSRGIEYSRDSYNGKHKECVTTKEFTCKRQPDANQMFVDLYYNSV